MSQAPAIYEDDEVIYHDGDSFFSDLCLRIENAKTKIEIETYIFDIDGLGQRILNLMAAAVKRGVSAKLLIDGVGGSQWNHEMAENYRRQGIEVRFFHPLAWQKSSKKFWQSVGIRSLIYGYRKFQRRDHRKLYMVDDQIALVGSMNISDRHLASVFHQAAWRDTGVRISGIGVRALSEAFKITWEASDHQWNQPRQRVRRLLKKIHPRVILNYSFLQRRRYHAALIQRITEAKERIWITNPYFVPDQKLMKALMAKASEIDVHLLFPKKNDFFGVQYAMECCYSRLLKAGAKIHIYTPSMLHAKIIMIDDRATIGSSNLDHLSLFKNYEADVIISRPENRALIRDQFEKDLKVSEEVSLTHWKRRSLIQKILEQLFYRFRGML